METKIENGAIRTCAGCRGKRPQGQLMRVARGVDGAVKLGRHGGRGAYVCFDRSCVERALSSGALRRALRLAGAIPGEVAQELLGRADGGNEEGLDG